MTETLKLSVRSTLDRAREAATQRAIPSQFKGLHPDQAKRALYFIELARAVRELGLSNPYERSALSLEPPHPVPPSRLKRELEKIGGSTLRLRDADMSLISLSMVTDFAPDSEAGVMLTKLGVTAPLCLLDHLYGFVFFTRDGKFHNHCLAIDFWSSRLSTMPRQLKEDLWRNRADNLLSGGALAGRSIFNNIIPHEPDDQKRSEVAEVVVQSELHLQEVVAALREGAKQWPNVQLWFRGQGRDYQVPDRTLLLRSNLTPYSNIRESSLVPSLYRRFDDHLENLPQYEVLLEELNDWISAAQEISPPDPTLEAQFNQQQRHAKAIGGLTSFHRGLILQQYGAPSPYLDITSDASTAAWFAVHHCAGEKDGSLRFANMSWSGEDQAEWPTIFVFPLVPGEHPFLDLASILDEDVALRPKRQACGLIGGAGNLARNYCARYVGLKLRLHPGFRLLNPEPARYYFPSDVEDATSQRLQSLGFSEPGRAFPLTRVHEI